MTGDELKQIKDLIDDRAAKTERHFDEKAMETQGHFDDMAAEMKRHFDEKATETRRHFDVVGESLRADIRVVAEGHDMLNEKMDRMGEEMRSGFDEVRSAIRFSYAEIDRRVSTLESHVVTLASRLERVEALVAHFAYGGDRFSVLFGLPSAYCRLCSHFPFLIHHSTLRRSRSTPSCSLNLCGEYLSQSLLHVLHGEP